QEGQPNVSELAEQIKSLKNAHSIEAAPERTGKRRQAGEPPVTARLHRHTDAKPTEQPSPIVPAEPPPPPATEPPPPTATAPPSAPGLATPKPSGEGGNGEAPRPARTFRERFASLPRQRQRSLF